MTLSWSGMSELCRNLRLEMPICLRRGLCVGTHEVQIVLFLCDLETVFSPSESWASSHSMRIGESCIWLEEGLLT